MLLPTALLVLIRRLSFVANRGVSPCQLLHGVWTVTAAEGHASKQRTSQFSQKSQF